MRFLLEIRHLSEIWNFILVLLTLQFYDIRVIRLFIPTTKFKNMLRVTINYFTIEQTIDVKKNLQIYFTLNFMTPSYNNESKKYVSEDTVDKLKFTMPPGRKFACAIVTTS